MKSNMVLFGAAISLARTVLPAQAKDMVAQAKAYVAQATSSAVPWSGPNTGPKAQPGKFIVYVSEQQTNGGARGAGDAVREAAKAIGWRFRLLDGKGNTSGQNAALSQAISMKPDGIVLGGLNIEQSLPLVERAVQHHVQVVGWNIAPTPGPMMQDHVFYNVTQNPLDVAKAAAYYAIAKSDGHANVVIFTTSEFALAMAKSDAMAKFIKQCAGCKVLATENIPLDATQSRMPQVTTALLQRFAKTWTYSLAINDLYYDYMAPALSAASRKGDGPPYNISAGDGSNSAFQRIRTAQYQTATVAAPLGLQGWQCVDELNRAFAGQKPATETDPIHLVTSANIKADGGAKNVFDPQNGYEQKYRALWGK